MDLEATVFVVLVSAGIAALFANRTLVWVRPGEVAEVTLFGVPRPPLGPGLHYVGSVAVVRRRPAAAPATAGPPEAPAIGEVWTVVRPTNPFVPSGSVQQGTRQRLAVSPAPLGVGARVVVAGAPVRFLLPEVVEDRAPPPPLS